MTGDIHLIEPGCAEWPEFCRILTEAGLPTTDLDEPAQHFFMLDLPSGDHAFGGFYLADYDALLRSIVVPIGERGRGSGQRMVGCLLAQLRSRGVARTWLLATKASTYFARFGFVAVERREAPAAIATTREFAALCPASADLLCLTLA